MNGRPFEVYWVAEAGPDSEGVARYSGDPDEFTALAWWWIATRRMPRDGAVAVRPADPEWFRWVPGGEYDRTLYTAAGPGRGAWLGAEIRTVQIGCTECGQLHGAHDPDCLNAGLAGLVTLQFHGGKSPVLSDSWIHAVRHRPASHRLNQADTPGPTLCGFDRFAPGAPTWSVGGGVYDPAVQHRGCYLCGLRARREFAGLAITGTRQLAVAFATSCRVPLAPHLDHDGAWRDELAREQPEGAQIVVDGSCL